MHAHTSLIMLGCTDVAIEKDLEALNIFANSCHLKVDFKEVIMIYFAKKLLLFQAEYFYLSLRIFKEALVDCFRPLTYYHFIKDIKMSVSKHWPINTSSRKQHISIHSELCLWPPHKCTSNIHSPLTLFWPLTIKYLAL